MGIESTVYVVDAKKDIYQDSENNICQDVDNIITNDMCNEEAMKDNTIIWSKNSKHNNDIETHMYQGMHLDMQQDIQEANMHANIKDEMQKDKDVFEWQ